MSKKPCEANAISVVQFHNCWITFLIARIASFCSFCDPDPSSSQNEAETCSGSLGLIQFHGYVSRQRCTAFWRFPLQDSYFHKIKKSNHVSNDFIVEASDDAMLILSSTKLDTFQLQASTPPAKVSESPPWGHLFGTKFFFRAQDTMNTPLKINGWNIIMEVWKIIFLSNGWFVGSMLIFQGVLYVCGFPSFRE